MKKDKREEEEEYYDKANKKIKIVYNNNCKSKNWLELEGTLSPKNLASC